MSELEEDPLHDIANEGVTEKYVRVNCKNPPAFRIKKNSAEYPEISTKAMKTQLFISLITSL